MDEQTTKWLSVPEVAQRFKVTVSAVYAWIEKGWIKAKRVRSGLGSKVKLRISEEEVLEAERRMAEEPSTVC